jgi:hypothetical protein
MGAIPPVVVLQNYSVDSIEIVDVYDHLRRSGNSTMVQSPWPTEVNSLTQDKVEERRTASRYNLALPVEIKVAPNLAVEGSISVKTRDISTHGFYFNIAQEFTVGTRFEFSIALPIEITGLTQAYISGTARAVRVEAPGESHPGRSGVGAIIERYQVSRGGS